MGWPKKIQSFELCPEKKKRDRSSNVDIQGQSTPRRVEVEAGACGLGEGPSGG